jgi:inhibitor of cysteine peptidase
MMRAMLIALGLAACAPAHEGARTPAAAPSGEVAAPTPADVKVRITAAEAGQTVAVKVGERFAVELVGVPTAGYVWAPKTLPAFVTRAGEAAGNTTRAQSEPGFTGGNHWEVFMFAATRPGTGALVFEQRRPWESSEPPANTFTVTIEAR